MAAETEAQRRLALQNASGLLGRHAAEWRESLVEAGALLLADLDFPDEELDDRLLDAAVDDGPAFDPACSTGATAARSCAPWPSGSSRPALPASSRCRFR